jgi:ABC-2 type transport system ATP-binding protein
VSQHVDKSCSDPAVQIDSLRLRTDRFTVRMNGWSVPRGACVAFVGHNGSGKTSVLDSLLGLRRDAEINARMLGEDVATWRRRSDLRQRLGVLLQRAAMPYGLYVHEVISLHRNIYGRTSERVLEELGICDLRRKSYEQLSRGERQRVDLFFALAHEPELIILDEPFTGLDQRVAQVTADLIERLDNSTVLMACHSELELSMADTMVWLEYGTVRDCGNPDALRRRLLGDFRLEISLQQQSQANALVAAVGERTKPQFVQRRGNTDVVVAGEEAVIRAVPSLVAPADIVALQYGRTTLADLLYRCAHPEAAPEAAPEIAPLPPIAALPNMRRMKTDHA